jgi:hypothetical protein
MVGPVIIFFNFLLCVIANFWEGFNIKWPLVRKCNQLKLEPISKKILEIWWFFFQKKGILWQYSHNIPFLCLYFSFWQNSTPKKKCWVTLVLQSTIDLFWPKWIQTQVPKRYIWVYSTFGFFLWNYYHSVLDISRVVIPNHLDSNSLV